MMARDEYEAAEDLVRLLRGLSGTSVTFSNLVRAMLSLAQRATPAIEGNAEILELPPRPANNNHLLIAEYEDALADYLLLALRDRKNMDLE